MYKTSATNLYELVFVGCTLQNVYYVHVLMKKNAGWLDNFFISSRNFNFTCSFLLADKSQLIAKD